VRKLSLAILSALFLASSAQAILIDERTPDVHYLEAANQDNTTCQITVITSANGATSSGTGVLIGKNLVVTAAHVVDGMCSTGIVRFGANDGSGEQVRQIKSFYTHPGYAKGPHGSGVDLAILVLDAPVTIAAPVPLSPVSEQVESGFMVCVGYGKTGTLSSGINEGYHRQLAKTSEPHAREIAQYLKSGFMATQEEKMQLLKRSLTAFSRPIMKRMAVVPVQRMATENSPSYYVMYAPAGEVPHTLPHALYGAPRQGDSGAGLVDASGHLVGILNHITNDTHICFLDLTAYKEWIQSIQRVHG
jgi:hypothetical protein